MEEEAAKKNSPKVSFTKSLIESVKPPAPGQRLVLKDSKTAGLQCRITSEGVKTFSVYRRIKGGPPERVTLGKFPSMTVEQARTQASQVNAAIDRGESPAQVKRAHKEELTFSELFDEYLEHAKGKKRTWKDDQNSYRIYLEKPLGKKKVSEITRQNIAIIHAAIPKQIKESKAKKPKKPKKTQTGEAPPVKKEPKYKTGATANRLLALVSSIFGWGMKNDKCTFAINPAIGIKKNKERSRDRFLQPDELPKFFQSLAIETNKAIRDYVLLSLLTGARRENVLSMRWDQISFERKEWRIPRTKNGDHQTIPLMEEVIKVLEERKESDDGSDYVFSGEGKNGHLAEPRRGWERILKRAAIENLRIHDLRRTMGSWQARTGASLVIVGKSLGHKSPQATAVYARLDLDPVRKSVETATAAMLEAAGVKKTAEVKEFKKGRKRK